MYQETHVKKSRSYTWGVISIVVSRVCPHWELRCCEVSEIFHEEFNGKDFTCTGKHSVGDNDKAG